VPGAELAQRLRAQRPRLKVLYSSGYSGALTQNNCQLKPGLNFLPKPYSATALAQAVRLCLGSSAFSTDTTRSSRSEIVPRPAVQALLK